MSKQFLKTYFRKLRRINTRLNNAGAAFNREGATRDEQKTLLTYGNKLMAQASRYDSRVRRRSEARDRRHTWNRLGENE